VDLPDTYLDCRGKLCPLPLLEVQQVVEDMAEGILVVVVDRLAAKENITRAMVEAGHSVLVDEQGDEWVLTITKEAEAALPEVAEQVLADAPGASVVLITDRVLGRPDPDLGRILMKSLLTTLNLSGQPPQALVLLHGGVRLACQGSDCIDALRALAEQGVLVLACGTCLDYLGLIERLEVGRVSNMAEIVGLLQAATKVISL
jgi:selenium metabolism protein YedF